MKIDQIQHTANSKTVCFEDGCLNVRITNVMKFAKFAVANFDRRPQFVFRGQSNGETWSLQPTFQRLSHGSNWSGDDLRIHLQVFRHAARGRRGPNPRELQEDEWWTLGQHYGLATPFLDWTRSYWVALYFAFCDSQAMCSTRAVYAADLSAICDKSASLHNEVQMVDPESQDNPRLTSQSGVLLKLSIARSLEEWVQEHFRGGDRVVLTKIMIPNEDIEYCLRDPNRMNINHLSLFPDLTGAAAYANTVFHVAGMVDTGIVNPGT